jgi:hypothetical protein
MRAFDEMRGTANSRVYWLSYWRDCCPPHRGENKPRYKRFSMQRPRYKFKRIPKCVTPVVRRKG